jgi:hypothetical protein
MVIVPLPVVETGALIPIVEPVEVMATLPPPEALSAPPKVISPVWFIVMPPVVTEAVMEPAAALVNAEAATEPLVDENAGAAPVTLTGPLMVTLPVSVMLTVPAFMAADTVTPAFAEVIVTEVSRVPFPTVPPKDTEPAPAVILRAWEAAFETAPAKLMFPPAVLPALDIKVIALPATLSATGSPKLMDANTDPVPVVVTFPFRVVVPPASVVKEARGAVCPTAPSLVAPFGLAPLELRVNDRGMTLSESTSPRVMPPPAVMVTLFVSVTGSYTPPDGGTFSVEKVPAPREISAPEEMLPEFSVRFLSTES